MAFKEIINQFADDLLVSIEEINDHVISATFTPILQI
jgi:hypothetical protein